MSEWKTKILKDLVDIKVSNVDKKIYPNKSLVRLCNYMDAYSNDYITNKISFSIGSADANEIKRFGLQRNDVIITKDSETPEDIAVSSVVIEELDNTVCGYHLAILRPFKEEVYGRFLMFKFKEESLKRYFLGVANGSTRFGLTIANIEKARIEYPPLPEQRKIATILSTCDAVIEGTKDAIVKYKAIKQGMLHDLFTRGIDITTGKLRPKFEDVPELYMEGKLGWVPKEWDEKRLEDLTIQIGDGIHSTPKYSANTNYYFINGNNLSEGEILIKSALCVSKEEYKKHYRELSSRTILYSINGTIGNIAIYNNEKVILGKSACYISCKQSVNLDYIFFILQTSPIQKFYELEMTGSTIKNLSLASVRNTPIAVPKNDKEQELIVARIRTINNKLQTEQTYLQKLHQIKAGLMADLLSGKKEVTVPKEHKALLHD